MKTKLGTTFLVAIIALAGVGISYAGFTDEIYIYGEAETATVKWCILDYSSTEIYKVWGEGAPIDELYYWHDYNMEDWTLPIDPWVDDFAGLLGANWVAGQANVPNAEFVSGAYAQPCLMPADGTKSAPETCDHCVNVDLVNMFPCQDFIVDFVVHYQGSIPGKIMDFVVDTYGPDGTELPEFRNGMNWLEYLWWLGMEGNNVYEYPDDPMASSYGIFIKGYLMELDDGEYVPTDIPIYPGYQLHYCDHIYIVIIFHIPQDNAFQGLHGWFDTTITVKQWNEVDETGHQIPIDI